jgi:hypothetical protein
MSDDPNAIPRTAVLASMQSEQTKGVLKAILEWLESASADADEWDAYTDFTDNCVSELSKIKEMIPPPMKKSSGALNRAIPRVRAMLSAMQKRDRTVALESGKAALREMM